MAGQKCEARLRTDVPAIHVLGLSDAVIASEAKQSSAKKADWIASSLRSSQ